MKGRKPKPTHLKLLEGNPGKRPINNAEPKPAGNLREAPDWLTESQKAGWRYAIDNAPVGLLKRLDQAALTVWVVAEDLHREAAVAVGKFGLVTKSPTKGEPMQNPYLAIVNRQAGIMMKAAAELGFSPSSRSRIQVTNPEEGEGNPFGQFAAG